MSWETFKQNILRVANNPQSINDIDIVAKTYATEYDDAVKRGGDTINGIPIQRGNVQIMEQIFKSALQKGLSSTEPYDLVGEMGKGVVAYWTGATLDSNVIPEIPAIGASQNIGVVTNIVINPGTWAPVVVSPPTVFQLTPEEKLDYENRLQIEISKYETEVITSPPDILEAREDTVSKFTGIIENNENYRVDIPFPSPIVTAGSKIVDVNGNEITSTTTTTAATFDGTEEEIIDIGGISAPVRPVYFTPRPPTPPENYPPGQYLQYTPYLPAGASVAVKAVAIALTDIKNEVKEIPDSSNTGHPRLLQIQRTAARSEWTEFPWCASAVFTWWYEAGFPFVTDKNDPTYLVNPKHCVSWQQWAVATGRWVEKRNGANPNFIPKAGDAVMYSTDNSTFDHIGMVYELKDGKLTSIDGNYKNSVSYNIAYTKYIAGYVQI
jgi:hypothetical protein